MRQKKGNPDHYSAGWPCSRLFFMFLTSMRSRDYHSFVMGGTESELNERENRAAQKRNFLFPSVQF